MKYCLLYFTLLYCAVLCCIVLYCAVLYCAVLCCAVLCCAVLCCAFLSCPVLCFSLLCFALLYFTLPPLTATCIRKSPSWLHSYLPWQILVSGNLPHDYILTSPDSYMYQEISLVITFLPPLTATCIRKSPSWLHSYLPWHQRVSGNLTHDYIMSPHWSLKSKNKIKHLSYC